ncbi:glucosamine-6-phosphate deaminase [Streptomyces luteolifulvus]|jgi:glucosamine-6-phosphate deaminase|uniref:Glucosamine-6-phosphate deaminase n=1 Tax=Streptomyces luteolifulvus TaxID=2615112 RepID=A0A6H9UVV0_9ACTN|nr:glucosamine-6-phosphate deaminase [Streptomyces luteolifulvus]KAB1143479.1 glucosamine-6-phosphate deaminase [Streptomyces luteolifulvus]
MEVVIRPDADDADRTVAGIVHQALADGMRTLGLATGSSPLGVYRDLARRHRHEGLSFAGVEAFLLGEYVGLPPAHPHSFAHVIQRELADHVDLDPARLHLPSGTAPDPAAEARRFERCLTEAGPVGLQILGIGVNGHIGCNEPGSSLASRTRLKTLTDDTRRDKARFFGSIEGVPRHVITQGLATIGDASHLVLVATGPHKARAVAAAVEGPVTAACPASVLQLHPHVTVVVDEIAASRLEQQAYYRCIARHKPVGQRY